MIERVNILTFSCAFKKLYFIALSSQRFIFYICAFLMPLDLCNKDHDKFIILARNLVHVLYGYMPCAKSDNIIDQNRSNLAIFYRGSVSSVKKGFENRTEDK